MSMSSRESASIEKDGRVSLSVLDLRTQWNYLLGEWRTMVRPSTLLSDVASGAAVALVALPLSLAIATASGVKPEVGLVTAVVGGVVVALFGGCRLQVSGPAAAMTFLVYEIMTKYGSSGLIVATMMAGLLQILSGFFRLGRFMQFMPRPVIAGFLSGIGLTILFTQLPVILRLEIRHDEEGGALSILWQTLRQLAVAEPTSLAVGLTAAGSMFLFPRISRRLPTPLIAVVAATLLPILMNWREVVLLGPLPSGFPTPELPRIPFYEWNELVMSALAIFVLASIESLLSASVVDSMAKETRVDNDQELVGQGLGNLASALFGGIPVTGVIARSATNIQSGARSRLSSIIHAGFLLAMMFVFAPWVAQIPRAALAGVLMAVALRMVEVHLLRVLWRGNRAEAAVFLGTTGAILATDLIVGVPVGMVAAFFYVVYETSQLQVRPVPLNGSDDRPDGEAGVHCPSVLVLEIEGPLFFGSGFHLRNVVERVIHRQSCLVVDLSAVPFLDLTGAELLDEAVLSLQARGVAVVLARPSASVSRRLGHLAVEGELSGLRNCPIYPDLRDAMLHATAELTEDRLCASCRASGRCQGLTRALEGIESLGPTNVPAVRAVIPNLNEAWSHAAHAGERSIEATPITPLALSGLDSERPGPLTSWNPRGGRPVIHPSAFVDPRCTLIGEVDVGEEVYIGPNVSVRADEGSPFHIGAKTNLQDGVILHALKGKVVLVEGRPYAIYVGTGVSLTHGALLHGPCYVGDHCFLGFKSIVHDSVIGEGCVIGMGAVVMGVTLAPGRYVPHNTVVEIQSVADALAEAGPDWRKFGDKVVAVNQELAVGHLASVHHPATPPGDPPATSHQG
ncbi:MAG: SulP family inorganic anion transporter [Isosphaeraceae bacterium]